MAQSDLGQSLGTIKYYAHRDYFWSQVSSKAHEPKLTAAQRRNAVEPVVLRPSATCPQWDDGPHRYARANAGELPRKVASLRDIAWTNGWCTWTTAAECMAPPTARRESWAHEKRITLWVQDSVVQAMHTRRAFGTWCNGKWEFGQAYIVGWPVLRIGIGANEFAAIINYADRIE